MLSVTENLQWRHSSKSVFTTIDLPHAMIKTNAIRATIAKQGRISQAVLRIMHKSVTIHLKPVNVFLLRQTKHTSHWRKYNHPLLQHVETQLYIVVNHPIIADTAFIHIGIAIIIR